MNIQPRRPPPDAHRRRHDAAPDQHRDADDNPGRPRDVQLRGVQRRAATASERPRSALVRGCERLNAGYVQPRTPSSRATSDGATSDGATSRQRDDARAVDVRRCGTRDRGDRRTPPRPRIVRETGRAVRAPALDRHCAGPGRFGLVGTPTGRRVRARLARFNAPWQSPQILEVLEPLIAIHRATHPKADLKLLQRGYDAADAWHMGQYRKSGDPYITHPLAVATILAELGMDTTTLVAALLHDTVEDTGLHARPDARTSSAPRSRIWSTASPSSTRSSSGDAAEAETIRKMVVAMAQDPRVLVIKLADRLHNMRTLRFLPPAKQERKARETLEVLAPLAHRLGMNTIKWELEDLAFATLYPKRYDEIVRLVAERAPSRDTLLTEVTQKRRRRPATTAKIKARGDRPAQALLLDLPEDDRARPRVHRHLRPRRHPHPGRHRARLLRAPSA